MKLRRRGRFKEFGGATFRSSAVAPGIVYSAQALAYFDALAGAGVSLATARKTAVDAWFVAGVTDGWLGALSFAALPVWGVEAANRINLISPASVISSFSAGWSHGIGGVVNGVGQQGYWDSGLVMPGNTANGFFWSTFFPDNYGYSAGQYLMAGTGRGYAAAEFGLILSGSSLYTDYPAIGSGERTQWPATSAQDLIAYNTAWSGSAFTRQLVQHPLASWAGWSSLTPVTNATSATAASTSPTATQWLGLRNDAAAFPSSMSAFEIAHSWWAFGRALTTAQLNSYGSATVQLLEACGAGLPFWVAESDGGNALLSESGLSLILY